MKWVGKKKRRFLEVSMNEWNRLSKKGFPESIEIKYKGGPLPLKTRVKGKKIIPIELIASKLKISRKDAIKIARELSKSKIIGLSYERIPFARTKAWKLKEYAKLLPSDIREEAIAEAREIFRKGEGRSLLESLEMMEEKMKEKPEYEKAVKETRKRYKSMETRWANVTADTFEWGVSTKGKKFKSPPLKTLTWLIIRGMKGQTSTGITISEKKKEKIRELLGH